MNYFYILLSISIFVFSCKNTQSSVQTTTELPSKNIGNIALYYELVHEAELALIQNKYTEAVDYYLAANEEGDLFVKDAENALLVAVTAKNNRAALVFAEKLLEKGVPKTYFEKRTGFNVFRASEEWKGLISAKKEYKKNSLLKKRIAELIAMDQQYRYDDYYRDTMLFVDSIIKNEILAIFDQYGYPNANVIGVSMQNDTTIERNPFHSLLLPQVAKNRQLLVPQLEAFWRKGN